MPVDVYFCGLISSCYGVKIKKLFGTWTRISGEAYFLFVKNKVFSKHCLLVTSTFTCLCVK